AHGDEAGRLVGRVDKDGATAHLWLIGDDADPPAAGPGQPGNYLGRPRGLDLEKAAAVDDPGDHIDDVIGHIGIPWDHIVGPVLSFGGDGVDGRRALIPIVGQV